MVKINTKMKYKIATYSPGADNPEEIAAKHLAIRQWQVDTSQNWFLDIYDSQDDLKNLEKYYLGDGGNFFIAKNTTGQIVGFVGLKNEGGGLGVFKRLAVVPQHQRQGIARSLVGEGIKWAEKNGFTKLSLRTGITENARPLYEEFGFKAIRFNEDRKDISMEKQL